MARILLVEDDTPVRTFVRRALELDGNVVVEAADGRAGLGVLSRPDSVFDLLVSDIAMPELDGIALAKAAKARRPSLPIILMTGYAHQREHAADVAAIVREVLPKPFSLDEIRRCVGRALAAAAACSAA